LAPFVVLVRIRLGDSIIRDCPEDFSPSAQRPQGFFFSIKRPASMVQHHRTALMFTECFFGVKDRGKAGRRVWRDGNQLAFARLCLFRYDRPDGKSKSGKGVLNAQQSHSSPLNHSVGGVRVARRLLR
jgi:hypothetical protein